MSYYFNTTTQDCEECDSSCRSCRTFSSNACLSCEKGFYPIYSPFTYLVRCEICSVLDCYE
jgi:hypothetical protein